MPNAKELYALFERAPDAIFIEDYEGYVLDANQAACELHGYTHEEMIGKHVLDLVPPSHAKMVVRDFPKWVNGEITQLTSASYDRHGNTIQVELRCEHITYEEKPALCFIARDISTRVSIEKALIASEKRFRQMVQHAPEALMLVDLESGCLVEANRNTEQLFGMTREELLQCGPVLLSPTYQPNGRLSEEYAAELIQTAGFDHPVVFEWEHLHASGTPILCEIRLLKLESNGRTLVRGSLSNITKQKQIQMRADELQGQLLRARRMETAGLLAGGVAHDLNNILGPMVGYPDLLLDELPDDSDLRDMVCEIRSSAERASSIIQELLILARRGDVQTERMDLRYVIEEYLNSSELKQIQQRKSGVQVEYKMERHENPIQGSKANIIRLVMNLVLNAIQAVPERGRVVVTSRREDITKPFHGYEVIPEGDYVVLDVSDDGHGIPKDQLEHIFDPFFSSKKLTGPNSGLGLAVVYGVIRDHHAFIDVNSEPGLGTSFRVYFPLDTTICQPPAPEKGGIVSASGRVLVVDDIKEQRDLATHMLHRMGLEVVAVENGHRALDAVSRDKFDLVLLDMVMEHEFDGLDTYIGIRERCPLLPCLIVSGYAESERIREALALGAGPHVKKPYTLAQLSAAIEPVTGNVHASSLA